jgi:hypothetical protein
LSDSTIKLWAGTACNTGFQTLDGTDYVLHHGNPIILLSWVTLAYRGHFSEYITESPEGVF